jgi:hypothetical protein
MKLNALSGDRRFHRPVRGIGVHPRLSAVRFFLPGLDSMKETEPRMNADWLVRSHDVPGRIRGRLYK